MRNATLSRKVGGLEVVSDKNGPGSKLQERMLAQVADEDPELLLEASRLNSVSGSVEPLTIEQRGVLPDIITGPGKHNAVT
jgi:hypothetical protein